jgi:propanol-preferring alcohol dehydrogenase
MKAMVINHIARLDVENNPLKLTEFPDPHPGNGEILIEVSACGVCHTEIDEIEGRTPPPLLPVIPGHQVVGKVVSVGSAVQGFRTGDRVGVAWIYSACGRCSFCQSGQENLCADFKATGRDANGGYAQLMVAPAAFSFGIPDVFSDIEAAPQLCAGAVGYRSLQLTRLSNGKSIGLSGFGASGHLVLKLIRHKYPDSKIFVFSRSAGERDFAIELGASWAGDFDQISPELLGAIIDTTPVWKPVVEALRNLEPGGRLVINAIRKEEADKDSLLRLHYPEHLWLEKEIKSVANVTRKDVMEYLALAASIPIKPEVMTFPLEDANKALRELKNRNIRGAKVLKL